MNFTARFQEQGRIEGQKAGLTAGYIEGRILGCERAFEVNREVGFYAGIAKEILKEFGENSSISGGRRQEGGGQEEAGDGIKDVHQSESSTDDNDEELAGKTSKNTHKTLSKR